tara:strand:+ start:141 stop:356 length:216 start_codon:yes stop_codon:yes gene_type:complete
MEVEVGSNVAVGVGCTGIIVGSSIATVSGVVGTIVATSLVFDIVSEQAVTKVIKVVMKIRGINFLQHIAQS